MTTKLPKFIRRVALVTIGLFILAAPTQGFASTYVTMQFGRAQFGVATPGTCQLDANSVNLPDVLQALQARNYRAVATAQLSTIAASRRLCGSQAIYASWDDLTSLHSTYGLELASAGDTLKDYTTLSDAEVWQHSCGTLDVFQSHGFSNAWAEFAFPNNRQDSRTDAIVNDCFAFLRKYHDRATTLPITSPFIVNTYSLTGGRCNDSTGSCYTMKIKNNRVYPDPQKLINMINSSPTNSWFIFQAYRFVRGSSSEWDCTSSDWRQHWTKIPESFCWTDYLRIVDGINPAFTHTLPITMASSQARLTALHG
jgi:hypothetical protein